MADTITAREALEWLDTQVLLFASRPAPGNKRLRLWYRVAERRWEIVLGNAEGVAPMYGHADINQAVAVFNEMVAEYESSVVRG